MNVVKNSTKCFKFLCKEFSSELTGSLPVNDKTVESIISAWAIGS